MTTSVILAMWGRPSRSQVKFVQGILRYDGGKYKYVRCEDGREIKFLADENTTSDLFTTYKIFNGLKEYNDYAKEHNKRNNIVDSILKKLKNISTNGLLELDNLLEGGKWQYQSKIEMSHI